MNLAVPGAGPRRHHRAHGAAHNTGLAATLELTAAVSHKEVDQLRQSTERSIFNKPAQEVAWQVGTCYNNLITSNALLPLVPTLRGAIGLAVQAMRECMSIQVTDYLRHYMTATLRWARKCMHGAAMPPRAHLRARQRRDALRACQCAAQRSQGAERTRRRWGQAGIGAGSTPAGPINRATYRH